MPIVHVNADDPAAAAAIRLALAYRRRFGRDVIVDLVGYRRFGHNEQDEPAYTQPLMAARIADIPPSSRSSRSSSSPRASSRDEDVDRLADEVQQRLKAAHEQLKETFGKRIPAKSRDEVIPPARPGRGRHRRARRAPARAQRAADPGARRVHRPPEAAQAARAAHRRASTKAAIDWGHAEALAFASLLTEAVPIRLTGQDSERGTFAQRHLVLHDAAHGRDLRADAAPARRQRVVRGAELAAVGGGCARLRVRLHRPARPRRSCSGRPSTATS